MTTNNGSQKIERNNKGNVDSFYNKELNRTREQTQAGAENLQRSAVDQMVSRVGTQSDLMIQQKGLKFEKDMRTREWVLSNLDELLQAIKDTKSGIVKKGLPKEQKRMMDDAKSKLNQCETQIETKRKSIVRQDYPEIYDNDVVIVKNFWQQINEIRKYVGMNQRGEASKLSYNSVYNTINQQNNSNFQQIEQGVHHNQKVHILNENIQNPTYIPQNTTNYYRKINGGTYTQTYNIIPGAINNPLVINNPGTLNYNQTIPGQTIQTPIETGRTNLPQGNISTSYENMSLGDAFQQGGLAGVIDKGLSCCKNMTPGQRNMWKNIAVLGGYAAGIFGLFKFFTNKKMGFWRKALATGGIIFGSQLLTGENPISLFNKAMTGGISWEDLQSKFGNTFGDAVSGVGNSGVESASTITPAMYSMMIFNPKTTVGNVRTMTTTFKTDEKAWTTFRGEAINKLKNKYGENCTQYFSNSFTNKFDEQKWNGWLNSFGITDSTQNNKLLYELANNATMNEIVIEKFRTERGVKETSNKVKKKEFEEYVNNLKKTNQAIDIKVLESHTEWFELDKDATYTERPEDVQFKENLVNQVESLSINNQKKTELKDAVKRFYDERSINTKPKLNDFSLKMENGLLTLTSHSGERAKIDINKGEIIGFGSGIRFASLSDILNTADIANEVLDTQKGKLPKDMPPFQYKIERKGICFNDATSVRKDIITRNNTGMDTRVLSTGWGGATSKIDTLYNHPKEFADYLSNRRTETNQLKMNLSSYPIMKKLSDLGLIFTNEQEVKQAETRLNKVKDLRSMANKGTQGYKPFSIEGNKLVFSTSDTKNATKLYFPDQFPNNFSGKSLDLSNFPTILGNKTKFLEYMNDIKNGMRGSKLN